MRDLIRGVLALLLLSLVWLPSSAAGPSAEAGVLVDDFVRSFNAHDAKGFGLLFTDDADWVSVAGIRVKGRTNIQAEHHEAFTTFFSSATLALLDRDVRMVKPDVAVIHFNWELTGQPDKEGKLRPPRRGIITIVATKHESTWKISAGQNTNLFQ